MLKTGQSAILPRPTLSEFPKAWMLHTTPQREPKPWQAGNQISFDATATCNHGMTRWLVPTNVELKTRNGIRRLTDERSVYKMIYVTLVTFIAGRR